MQLEWIGNSRLTLDSGPSVAFFVPEHPFTILSLIDVNGKKSQPRKMNKICQMLWCKRDFFSFGYKVTECTYICIYRLRSWLWVGLMKCHVPSNLLLYVLDYKNPGPLQSQLLFLCFHRPLLFRSKGKFFCDPGYIHTWLKLIAVKSGHILSPIWEVWS